MPTKPPAGADDAPKPAPRTAPPPGPLDDLSIEEILAAEPPPARRARKRETSKSLGVYDADATSSTSICMRSPHAAAHAGAGDRHRAPVRAGDETGDAGTRQAQPALRDLGREEVPEPRPAAHRPDRRGERRADDGRAEVRSRPGREVHLVRRLVDPPVDPRRARAPGPHRARAAQSHRRPLAHRAASEALRQNSAASRRPRRSRRPPGWPSMSCRRSPRSTRPTCASTHRSTRTAIAR
jgi:hypothetical protein